MASSYQNATACSRIVPDLRSEIANLSIVGEKRSEQFLAPGQAWSRNQISWRLSGKTVDLFQRPIVFQRPSRIVNKWAHTTTLFVRNVQPKDQKSAERIATDLCHLLSFATMSEVRPFAFSYAHHGHRWNGEGLGTQFRSPIESDGESVRKFVDTTWSSYRKLKRSRSLPELIHYLTLTDHPDQPLEVRMLLAFVALENMKGSWARASGIPFRRGSFVRVIRKATGGIRNERIPFEELLERMFEAVGMRPALKRIVRVRNQIVHFGLTSRSFKANLAYYERTKAIEHEYVLRVLGYQGVFYDYQTQSAREL